MGGNALVEAGASDQKARAAAEAVANFDERFNRIETKLTVLQRIVSLIIVVEIFPYIKNLAGGG